MMRRIVRQVVRGALARAGYEIVRKSVSGNAATLRFDCPEPPAGLKTGPPDFVGIGVQKAGTSWWFDLIARHPDVYVPEFMIGDVEPAYLVKERHFFDRFFQDDFLATDVTEYQRWFPRLSGCITGEWTPRYVVDPWVPPLLLRAAPAARLLVMLRDPVDRFASGMGHEQRWTELDPGRAVEHFARGLYYQQLATWLRYFDERQVLVLQYEQCVADPRRFLASTFKFLGIDESWTPAAEALVRRVNPRAAASNYVMPPNVRSTLVDRYSADAKALAAGFPGIDLRYWPNFQALVQ